MSLSHRGRSTLTSLLVLSLVATSATTSSAVDEKKVCAIAAEQAQRLKNDHKYRDARDQLLICTRAVCPSFVRSDCEPWLSEVEKAMPSVVVGAKDDSGADVMDVRVLIDGISVAEKLDGSALGVDPGSHQFRFERTTGDFDPVEQKVDIGDGEKAKKIAVVFHAHAAPPPKVADPKPVTPPPSGKPAPILGFVAAGVGVVALGVGGYFYLSAKNDIDDLKGSCAPHCDASRVSPIDGKIVVSDVALGVGVVAAATAVTYFVLWSVHKPTTETLASHVQPNAHGFVISF